MTGSPRSSGRRWSSTEAKNASQSRWAMTRFATPHRVRAPTAHRTRFGPGPPSRDDWTAIVAVASSLDAEPGLRVTRLARREDRAGGAEAQLALRRRRQVELAAGHVGAAVDDRDAHGAPLVVQRDLGAAGQRLVSHAERAGRQGAAAREVLAVEARAVP